ncbi:unnamed protein product, partial [Pelagomonas calceolata]
MVGTLSRCLLGPVGDEAGGEEARHEDFGHVVHRILLLVGAEEVELGVVRAGDGDAGDPGHGHLERVLRVELRQRPHAGGHGDAVAAPGEVRHLGRLLFKMVVLDLRRHEEHLRGVEAPGDVDGLDDAGLVDAAAAHGERLRLLLEGRGRREEGEELHHGAKDLRCGGGVGAAAALGGDGVTAAAALGETRLCCPVFGARPPKARESWGARLRRSAAARAGVASSKGAVGTPLRAIFRFFF